MRCLTCDMEVTERNGNVCAHCENIAFKMTKAPAAVPEIVFEFVIEPEPAPAPEPVFEPAPAPEPEVRTVTDLRLIYKSDLIDLADSLGLDLEGNKEDLVARIADKLGIEY